jgi:hypothetical protein
LFTFPTECIQVQDLAAVTDDKEGVLCSACGGATVAASSVTSPPSSSSPVGEGDAARRAVLGLAPPGSDAAKLLQIEHKYQVRPYLVSVMQCDSSRHTQCPPSV